MTMWYSTVGGIVTLTLSLLAAPVITEAQQASNIWRIAFLGAESPSTNQHFLDAFRQGLRELGYVEGQNMILEARWAAGSNARFPDLVAELVRLKVHVMLAISTPAAVAAKHGTQTIPIVFIAGDPFGSGLVPSLAQPGGNVTGLSTALAEEFPGKWLELLREAVPNVFQVAVLWNPTNPANARSLTVLQGQAQRLGVTLQPQAVQDPSQFDSVFAMMATERTQGLVVLIDPLTVRYRAQIVDLAAKNRLPAMYGFREFVEAGGLLAYGPNVAELCRRATTYVDKILKGTKPGDLPVEQPTKIELVINLKTAKVLGITMPPSLLLLANEVIQ
jgi:putative tryptophan/tyrosine transport system substrate-binding protein